MDYKRIVDVSWDEEQPLSWIVRLSIYSENKLGMLSTISGVFSSNDSDIIQANVTTLNDLRAHGIFTVSVHDVEHLTRIMNALRNLKGVEKVERLGTA